MYRLLLAGSPYMFTWPDPPVAAADTDDLNVESFAGADTPLLLIMSTPGLRPPLSMRLWTLSPVWAGLLYLFKPSVPPAELVRWRLPLMRHAESHLLITVNRPIWPGSSFQLASP